MTRVEAIPELYSTTLWEFKAEGNANILLSYTGKNTRFLATVLRLRKEQKDTENEFDQSFTDAYVNFVIKPLLGSEYVGESILLEVQPEFLEALSNVIFQTRSSKRIQKDIDLKQRYVVLMPDHTRFSSGIGPTLSVELKPKWGFLPSSPLINLNSVKFQSCRFCMHKYLKQNSTDDITRYCPLDLFSLDDKRVRKAVEALLDGPGNNLKLFIQGIQIEIGIENWQARLYEFFGDDYPDFGDKKQDKKAYVTDMLIELLIKAIMEEQDLFRNLKTLQKTLDELDIEGINKLLMNYQLSEPSLPSLEEWKLVVDEYVKRKRTTTNIHACEFTNMDNKQIRQRIYEYLISATLKDCSIIFSVRKSGGIDIGQQSHFSPIFQTQERLQQITLLDTQSLTKYPHNSFNRLYVYKVNVIDLDPKPKNLSYYQELDAKIAKNYLKRGTNSKCSE